VWEKILTPPKTRIFIPSFFAAFSAAKVARFLDFCEKNFCLKSLQRAVLVSFRFGEQNFFKKSKLKTFSRDQFSIKIRGSRMYDAKVQS
jgi:hypothetical protein